MWKIWEVSLNQEIWMTNIVNKIDSFEHPVLPVPSTSKIRHF